MAQTRRPQHPNAALTPTQRWSEGAARPIGQARTDHGGRVSRWGSGWSNPFGLQYVAGHAVSQG